MRELSLNNSRLDKRYDVMHELGRGSYAEIFLARDTLASPQSPHSRVVIKALNVFLQDDLDPDLERTLVENFQNEAIALDRVRHPNIISRLGHGTARDLQGTVFHYLVLEYLEGGDLQRACREKAFSVKDALGYIEQVCAGLRHAHRHGIIHRDIKPQNILLTGDRITVKIADFGVARIFQSDAPITRVGTNIYAPPEHSPLYAGTDGEGNTKKLTPAADVYSLAKSTYTLLTGEAPRFYANNPITDLPLTCRSEDWAGELIRVLNRATLADPDLRHQSVDDLWLDLEAVRRIIVDAETATHVRPKLEAVPQPHVAPGYTPLAPQQPRFQTSRDLKLRLPLMPESSPQPKAEQNIPPQPAYKPMERVEDHWPNAEPFKREQIEVEIDPAIKPHGRGHRFVRRLAWAAVFLVLFAGALFGTSAYLRSLGYTPVITNPFVPDQFATANTDVNLRSGPSASTDLVGLVTRNSRVRILKTQGSWHQVEVISQGRERTDASSTNRGWLNGRFIDVEQ